ncbi:unnamed protein product [Angiostrongylus costaricensis]|uniref:DUF5753 domain-containing protein n=1 Tax=Angiostrongylus costaricensis TaxID=334426 RepID=A0A158PEM8_ANGCS|nr:unnamed protein product [Angiostrongylus costaricensis]
MKAVLKSPVQVLTLNSRSMTNMYMRVEFTILAAERSAVNLLQGFPDGPVPMFVSDILREVAAHPEKKGWHQYTRVEFLSAVL